MVRKTKLTEMPRPFICGTIWDTDVDSAIRTIKLAEYEGADAFELNLLNLTFSSNFQLNKKELKDIFSSTSKPIFTTFRRAAMPNIPRFLGSEDERIKNQLTAFEMGSSGFDMEIDIFSKVYPTKENIDGILEGLESAAVEKQKKIIRDVRERGGEMMMSYHRERGSFTVDEALKIGKIIEERGVDIAKIVGMVFSWEEFIECLRVTLALKDGLKIAFIYQAHGEHGKLTRTICPMLGSMLAFCPLTWIPGGFMYQPPIRNMKAVFDNIDWSITKPPEEERFL